MKSFNTYSTRSNPPGIDMIVEFSTWDLIRLLFGRELRPASIRQADFVTLRHQRGYELFNIDAGFDSGPLRRL